MTSLMIILTWLGLEIKHYVVDWLIQPKYEWSNKGTYGHMGGIIHAGKHTIATLFILVLIGMAFSLSIAWWAYLAIALVEGILHYHIDWAKMNINRIKGWTATTHAEFWMLTGTDQFAHALTYIGIVVCLILIT